MKRIISITIALVFICLSLTCLLTSCGKDKWYTAEINDIEYYISINEKDGEMTIITVDGKNEEEHSFDIEIDDDEIEIKDEAGEKATFDYEQDKKSVSINNIDFELVKDKKDIPDDPDDASSDLSIYQMFIFPNSDPEKAEENLENAGYIVSVSDDKISMALAGGSYDGCEAVLMAYNEEDDDDGIWIWYFEEKEDADEAWDDIEKFAEDLNEEAKEEDIDMVCKKSGKMIYVGTKQAIKDAK